MNLESPATDILGNRDPDPALPVVTVDCLNFEIIVITGILRTLRGGGGGITASFTE